MKRSLSFSFAVVACLTLSQIANAHFPWLAVEDGKVVYFFGETPADRTYKLPESITKAEVSSLAKRGKTQKLELTAVETDDFVGMTSAGSVDPKSAVVSKVTYGIYNGMRLNYYTQFQGGKLPKNRRGYRGIGKQLDLYAQAVDTDSGVDVFVMWQGKPLADAEVKLFCEDGHEEGNGTTNAKGKVSFNDKEVEDGLNGIMVGHIVDGEAGKIGDQDYTKSAHYLTMTFGDPEDFEESDSVSAKPEPAATDSTTDQAAAKITVIDDKYPAVPEMVTSFGAAIAGDSVYMYGGHMGRAHQYYAEAQGKTLWRLNLKDPKAWEAVSTDGPGLQGLAMVAHDGKLYRIGGFTAKNKDGEDRNLWSQANVTCFDPSTNKWSDMAPMPEPRSSFDAAVLDGKIYVVGGWQMQGDGETQWHKSAYMLDLSKPDSKWKALPEPPFQRRALSIAAHDGKVYVLGGMQRAGGPSTRVDVFDPKTNQWSEGPSLQGEGMEGFGSAAFAVGGNLYASTYSGLLQQLSADGKSWAPVTELERDRFFHRLLPLSENQLLSLGGASMSSGKFEEVDIIQID
ncbi:MAG: kelch repeat-containing protein [Planctomycetota bacterium]